MNLNTDREQDTYRPLRLFLGLSIGDVSRHTGINKGRLSVIERGVAPTPEEAKAIRDVLEAALKERPNPEDVAS